MLVYNASCCYTRYTYCFFYYRDYRQCLNLNVWSGSPRFKACRNNNVRACHFCYFCAFHGWIWRFSENNCKSEFVQFFNLLLSLGEPIATINFTFSSRDNLSIGVNKRTAFATLKSKDQFPLM